MSRYKSFFNRLIDPLAKPLARRGVAPALLTLASIPLTALVCWSFVKTGAVVFFCLAMAAVGGLDVLDGAVARLSGRVTQFGAYLDAMVDRYVEAMVVIAAAAVTGYWTLSLIALVGALLVSYAKARAAMEVTVSNQEWPDLMERGERSACFLIGLLAGELIPWHPLGRDLFWWTLVMLCLLVHLTVIQRVLRARRLIRQRS